MAKSSSVNPSYNNPVRPITSAGGKSSSGSLAPFGSSRSQSVNSDAAPSGMRTRGQASGGAAPSTSPPSGTMKTVGGHTAYPGLTPTTGPNGYKGPSMPPAGSMRSPGNTANRQQSVVGPSVPIKSVRTTGPSSKK